MESVRVECAPMARKRVRTVSNLTEEQIRKKRGSDRDAQRAFRERTRSRIQNLEDELRTLKAGKDGQSAALQKEVQDLQKENEQLKHHLKKIHELAGAAGVDGHNEVESSIIVNVPEVRQPVADQRENAGVENSQETAEHFAITLETRSPITVPVAEREPEGISMNRRSVHIADVDRTTGNTSPRLFSHDLFRGQESLANSANTNTHPGGHDHQDSSMSGYAQSPRFDMPYPSPPTNNPVSEQQTVTEVPLSTEKENEPPLLVENLSSDSITSHYSPSQEDVENISLLTTVSNARWLSNNIEYAEYPTSQQFQPTSENKTGDEYLDSAIAATQMLPASSHSSRESNISPAASISSHWAEPRLSKYTILPRHFAATCPLDRILLDFLSSRRLLASQGTPLSALVGPLRPAISGLLDPKLNTKAHPSSRVMVDVVATFVDTNLREKLGFLYIMYATMRWLIATDQESYENLPSWLHPTVLQVMVPHAAWIDNIPWPRVRDILIQNPLKYPFRDFSEMYARCARLNWPFEPMDAVMPGEADGHVLLNPLFEKHVRRLECWSVGELFEKRFPELAAEMRV